MRQKRAKAYRKLMSLYCMSFGFREPYQVLVDSEMCRTSISQKLDFVKQLGTVLQGAVKPMITQCCIHELYLLGKNEQPAVDLAKTFERRKCNHREAIPGNDCITDVVGEANKHRYVIATQSPALRSALRSVPAVPVVHINRSVMILEPPSDTTLRAKALVEHQSLLPSTSEKRKLATTTDDTAEPEPPKKKRKGPKGPNPLSVKKKKVQNTPKSARPITVKNQQEEAFPQPDRTTGEQPETSHKRKRRRKRTNDASNDDTNDAREAQ